MDKTPSCARPSWRNVSPGRGGWGWLALWLQLLGAGLAGLIPGALAADGSQVRFAVYDVYVDGGEQRSLAAWQVEVRAVAGDVALVGVEGGEHPAFRDPPRYDPKALGHGRVRLAGWSTNAVDALPHGSTRVAALQVRVTGGREPVWKAHIEAAADLTGRRTTGAVSVRERRSK